MASDDHQADFRHGSVFAALKGDFRGRDASYLAPPAQIRTSPIRAYGSHLGCVTARRDILTKFPMRFSACDTIPRYCARPVLCWLTFPSAPALASTTSAAFCPPLFPPFTPPTPASAPH